MEAPATDPTLFRYQPPPCFDEDDLRDDVAIEVRNYLRDLKGEKDEIRRVLERMFDQYALHEAQDNARHQEVKDLVAGLNARTGISENNIVHLKERISDALGDTGVHRLPPELSGRKSSGFWYRHKLFDLALKAVVAIATMGAGFLARHLLWK